MLKEFVPIVSDADVFTTHDDAICACCRSRSRDWF